MTHTDELHERAKSALAEDHAIGDKIDMGAPLLMMGVGLDPIGIDKYGRVWAQKGSELVMIADFSANL